MFWRGLSGALLGACTCAAVAASATVLLSGLPILLFDREAPADRMGDVKRLIEFLPTAAMAGLIVGGVGGLAAKLPPRGLRLVTSIGIVAGCALLARLPSTLQPRQKGSREPSYVPSVVGH